MRRKESIFMIIVLNIVFFSGSMLSVAVPQKCNGHEAFRDRRYNEVTYVATNNCHVCQESDVTHQDKTITDQLKSGVRALKLDVWKDRTVKGSSTNLCVCQGADQAKLYAMSEENLLAQTPMVARPFIKGAFKKLSPLKPIVNDALHFAYGDDEKSSKIPFRYCALDPSKRSLHDLLVEVKKFLDANKQEIVTLIIEDHAKNFDDLAKEFNNAGLSKYAHTQNSGSAWPTMGELVAANKRLVVLVQGDSKQFSRRYPWLHNMWDFAWDTEREFESIADLKNKDKAVNRGENAFKNRTKEPKNKLFAVNHFLTHVLTGDKQGAKRINRRGALKERLLALSKKVGHLPNFVLVDFYEHPNNEVFDVVDEINGVGSHADKSQWRI